MSWETVSAAIRFWPNGDGWNTGGTNSGIAFTATQQSQILGLLQRLYFGLHHTRRRFWRVEPAGATSQSSISEFVHAGAGSRSRP
jgi:hypothetical protein